MNCIQANAIEIRIDLKYQFYSDFDNNNTSLGNLYELVITDNGEGLNSQNLNAFFELATENKQYLGGKGIGWFSFLKIVNSVNVKSN